MGKVTQAGDKPQIVSVLEVGAILLMKLSQTDQPVKAAVQAVNDLSSHLVSGCEIRLGRVVDVAPEILRYFCKEDNTTPTRRKLDFERFLVTPAHHHDQISRAKYGVGHLAGEVGREVKAEFRRGFDCRGVSGKTY